MKPEGSCVLSHWPPHKAVLCVFPLGWISDPHYASTQMWQKQQPLSSRGAGSVKPPSSITGSRLPGKQWWGWACWAPGTQGRASLPRRREDVEEKGNRVSMTEELQQFKEGWRNEATEETLLSAALTKIQAVQLLDFCNIWENMNMVWCVWFENWLNAIRMENLQHLY